MTSPTNLLPNLLIFDLMQAKSHDISEAPPDLRDSSTKTVSFEAQEKASLTSPSLVSHSGESLSLRYPLLASPLIYTTDRIDNIDEDIRALDSGSPDLRYIESVEGSDRSKDILFGRNLTRFCP